MIIIEIKFKDKLFIVPTEPITPILIYQRYGYYYIDFEGWELGILKNNICKQRFNISLQSDDLLQIQVKTIEKYLISKLNNNEIENVNSYPLLEEDIQQMTAKYYTLEKLLTKEKLI